VKAALATTLWDDAINVCVFGDRNLLYFSMKIVVKPRPFSFLFLLRIMIIAITPIPSEAKDT